MPNRINNGVRLVIDTCCGHWIQQFCKWCLWTEYERKREEREEKH